MEQISLSEVCKKYGFTRRVIQGYEKEGLIKHTSKNKYGHLMYNEKEVKKIAYIRYLQMNGMTLKEISLFLKAESNKLISTSLLKQSNSKLKKEINRLNKLIKKNNMIIGLCSNEEDFKTKENKVLEIIMEEIKNEKTI